MSYILSLNCGTSSAKYAVFEQEKRDRVCHGIVERVGIDGTRIRHEVAGSEELRVERSCADHNAAIELIFEAITGALEPSHGVISGLEELSGVGHRVVHGGQRFVKSAVINDEVYAAISDMIEFAPLHIPANLAGVDAVGAKLPEIAQMAIFDTAFHQTLPPESYLYGVPYSWYERYGIRRYGFHGTSHLYITKRAAVFLGKPSSGINLVTLHIGNGISLSAIRNGVSVDHSMGLTPLEGAMMGTRSGSIDPAIVPFIAEKEHLSAQEVVDVGLNRQGGLKGIAGFTDMRDILKGRADGDSRCSLAFDMYCYRMRQLFGSYLAVLGYEIDAVVFAGGVGENVADVRASILTDADRVGIALDPEKNRCANADAGETDIATTDSPARVLVIPTNEEQVLLEDVIALLDGTYDEHTRFHYTFEDPDWQ